MKNKKVLLVSLSALVLLLAVTATILIVSLTGVNGCIKRINKSMQSVAVITTAVTVSEGESAVYGYERKVQIEGENSVVTVCESKLNSSFVLERQAEVQSEQKTDRKKLFGLDLKSKYLTDASFKNDKFDATISAQNLPKIFEGASTSSDAKLEIIFKDGKISALNCNYTSTAGHFVTLSVTYSY